MYNDTFDRYPIQTIRKPLYPFLLRQIGRPPRKLHIRGTIPDDQNIFLCVIGARHHSDYGKDAIRKIILGLKGYPVVIVSGLAIGIDSLAHEYALEAGLKTIAFPGSGLNKEVIYPASRIGLARRILDSGGALVSPFTHDQKSAHWTFPFRNTLMSAVSHAVLVIEAKKDSGTMITVGQAGEFNRDLYAVPGSIFSSLSYGPNSIIRNGGVAIQSADDLIESLCLIKTPQMNNVESTIDNLKFELFNESQKKFLDLLDHNQDKTELMYLMGMNPIEYAGLLTDLEIDGAISISFGVIRKII
jgi:DNA processing protein